MVIVGIDPGLDGGIVALDERGVVRYGIRMPTLGKGRRVLDLVEIRSRLWANGADIVYVEKQGPRPRDGRVSAFKTGQGYGQLIGLLHGMGQKHVVVAPKEWQGVVCKGLPKLDTKARTILAVEARLPALNLRPGRCVKPHTGIADAAGIAMFGLSRFGLSPWSK